MHPYVLCGIVHTVMLWYCCFGILSYPPKSMSCLVGKSLLLNKIFIIFVRISKETNSSTGVYETRGGGGPSAPPPPPPTSFFVYVEGGGGYTFFYICSIREKIRNLTYHLKLPSPLVKILPTPLGITIF